MCDAKVAGNKVMWKSQGKEKKNRFICIRKGMKKILRVKRQLNDIF